MADDKDVVKLDDALGALVAPTASDVLYVTDDYDTRTAAAVAASLALAASGGGVSQAELNAAEAAAEAAAAAALAAHAVDATAVHGITDTADLLTVATSLDTIAVPAATVDFNGQRITDLGTPTAATDAATKAYADAIVSGLTVKNSVRATTTADITLSGQQTIDGVAVVATERVLVKNQTLGAANGIYVVAAGAWARSTDADTSAEVPSGTFALVTEGTTQANTGWILVTANPITLGTTVLVFTQFSSQAAGAPTTANYLVGTAQGGLSAEIAVGTSPGGELGGTWASPTVDATHSGSSHAAVQSAAEATAAAALTTHEADTTAVHGVADTSALYRSGGTDVAVADGGTGASSAATALTNLGGVPATIVDAKGDLIVATAADTVARLAAGTIGQFPIADSAQVAGLRYVSLLPTAARTLYVHSAGSDSNDGLAPYATKATIQAAYDSLPSDGYGSTLILLDGDHNVGTGFVGANHKPCHITSLSGVRPMVKSDAKPYIYGTGTQLFTIGATSGFVDSGWAFSGVNFDITHATNTRAIQANDLNLLIVRYCLCYGVTSVEKYMVRSNHPLFADVSWYRIHDNYIKNCGSADLASGEGDGNTNNNNIVNNVIYPGDTSWGFKAYNFQRSVITGNNIEGNGPGGIKLTGNSQGNVILGNGGEGTLSPFLEMGTSTLNNLYLNVGSTGSAVATSDLSGANFRFARAGYQFISALTDDYTLATTDSAAPAMLEMNKATAVTVTVPPNATVPWGIGKSFTIRQKGAGQVTLAPGAAVTLRSRSGLKTAGQYAVINAIKVATNEWQIWGDTTA